MSIFLAIVCVSLGAMGVSALLRGNRRATLGWFAGAVAAFILVAVSAAKSPPRPPGYSGGLYVGYTMPPNLPTAAPESTVDSGQATESPATEAPETAPPTPGCDRNAIIDAQHKVAAAIANNDHDGVWQHASDGMNAEAVCIEHAPPSEQRAERTLMLAKFMLYAYVYGDRSRTDFLATGKAAIEAYGNGEMSNATRTALADTLESINEKLAMSQSQ